MDVLLKGEAENPIELVLRFLLFVMSDGKLRIEEFKEASESDFLYLFIQETRQILVDSTMTTRTKASKQDSKTENKRRSRRWPMIASGIRRGLTLADT